MFRTTWYYLLENDGAPRGPQMRERGQALSLAAGIARRGHAVEVFSVVVETPSGLCGEPRLVARYAPALTEPGDRVRLDNIIPFRPRRRL